MKKILLWCTLLTSMWLSSQTVLINPAAEGGFENGSTFAANGWSTSSGTNNPWVVDAYSNGAITGNAAFISTSTASPYVPSYSNVDASSSYFWRDVTVPAGHTKIKLNFNWLAGGESTWDLIQVFIAPTTITPVGSNTHPGSGAANVPTEITGATSVGSFNVQPTTVQSAEIFLPASLGGQTFRLIFYWKSDTTTGDQLGGIIDNISLTSASPDNFISVATGNWNDAATWDANAVPTSLDNAIVSPGHTVTLNATGLGIHNLTVNGTLAYGTPTSFAVNNNLTVNTGGLVNVFSGTTGKTLSVSGDILNNGEMNVSIGSTSAGTLTLNGTQVQTVSGSGTFTDGRIRNLLITNTSTTTPNINWQAGNITVVYNLNLTGGRVNLGTSKLTFGYNAVGNTLTAPAGSGLVSGKFSRYYTATTTGSAINAGAIPTTTTSKFPFVSPDGNDRSMWISRTNSTGGVAGELAVTYAHSATVTTGLSIADGPYTVTDRYNGNWTVSNEGTGIASGSYKVAISAQNAFFASNGNVRVIGASASAGGDHQDGTTLPHGQRVAWLQNDLLAGPLYLGINNTDVPYVAVSNGNWNSAATWNKGVVPTCTSPVVIPDGMVVTINSAGNTAASVTTHAGGTLTVASGDLLVGCTDNNSTLTNNGTLTVSGGTLAVNGNIWNAASSTFNQFGGDIVIDGNNGGSVTGSVLSGTALLHMASNDVNMTGGVLTIVDPHAATTASSTINYSVGTSGSIVFSPNHTLRLGNGVSTDAGGNLTNGFRLTTYPSSGRISKFGKLEINTLGGTNRHVTSASAFGVHDLEIHANSQFRMNSTALYIAGNFINNGLYASSTTTYLADYAAASNSPTNVAQTISGTGQFHNASITVATLPTLNDVIYSLSVNNSSTAGVTLARPLGLSNILTLTEGVIHTSTANLLSVGFNTTAGTMTTGSNTAYINGPVSKVFANAYTGTQLFPVGKGGSYSPIWISPKTTALSKFTAQAFNTNTGTASSSITGLANDRRWEVALDSGSYTTIKVKVGSPNIQGSNIIVQAPTANGVYTNDFGNVATFVAATATIPATIESDVEKNAADFTGFISYASPLCPAPSLVSATTTSASADISWTGTTMAANGYVVYYSTINTAPDGSTVLDTTNSVSTASATATSVTIPGLMPATTYYFWVRSACNATENSEWVGPTLATTECIAVQTFSQNFDGVTTPALPNCWKKVGTTGTIDTRSGTFGTSPNVMYMYSSSASNIAMVAMPAVSNLDTGLYSLKFKARANITAGGVIEVGYLNNPTDQSTFTILGSFIATSTTIANNFIIEIIGVPTGVTTLAFRHNPTPSNSVLIDDVEYALTSSLAITETKVTTSEVKVYPNPFTDVINISDVKDLKSVSVIDASGRMVKTIATPGTQIHLGELKSGLYILKLDYRNGSVKTVKVVKK